MSPSPRSLRRAPACAAVVTVGALACVVLAVLVHQHVTARTDRPVVLSPDDLVLATAYPVVAILIVAHQPRNAVGWLMLSTAWMGPYLLSGQYAALALLPGHDPLGWQLATWVAVWGYLPYFVLVGLVPLHFPGGRLPDGRLWRRLRGALVGVIAVETVARMLAPVAADAAPDLINPLALPHGEWVNMATAVLSVLALVGGGLCGLAAVVWRLRRSGGDERARLQWLVFGMACLVVSSVVAALARGRASTVALSVGLLLMLAALTIGVVRHRLFDIGTALSRTLVYAPLTGLLLLAYAATVAGAGSLTTGSRITYAVVALVALAAAAARDQLQRLVDRLVFGERGDPYAVLRRVHGRLDLATGPVDALAQLAAGIAAALRLPYLAVLPDDPRLPVIREGTVVGDVEHWVARDRSEPVGRLVVGHRREGERFAAGERAMLEDVARRAGTLLASAALVHDLQRSREALVDAREEERLRMRRDLHDSVGPRLAGMAMQLDAVTGRMAGLDPELADQARSLGGQLRETVAELRHAVEGLRPPALDELGLAEALRQLVRPFDGVVVEAPVDRLRLPAAVEVAAFRIAAEAVTNAVRHSGCRLCRLTLRAEDGWLMVEAADDGSGLDADAEPGVGLRSIRERASEVGGRLEVADRPGGGTVVRARIPLPEPRAAADVLSGERA